MPSTCGVGSNGHSCDGVTKAIDKGCWTVGLVNSKFKYMSAETYGFRINANGKSLKKRQIWRLEPSGDGESVALKSCMERYMAVDQFGNVTCDKDEKDDTTKFEISVSDDLSGRWAFRSLSREYFLGANGDNLQCVAKKPGESELWYVHLAARPQVNLRSVGRKRYAHLSEEEDEIHVEENVPWGENTLFTLEFREEVNKYAIHTSNNMYLQKDGKLSPTINKDCFLACEYHGGHIALRDSQGQYLAPIGSKAVLKTRSKTVTKDELFLLEDSLPQASFVAAMNNRFVSVKQGMDVTANQEEISNHETFQLEYNSEADKWFIRTMQDRYFSVQAGGGIQASDSKRSSDSAQFEIVWHEDGSVSFIADNGKYVGTKKSGHLYANCDQVEEKTKFYFYLINRPILVLKCEQGFVGYKSATGGLLECNKAAYETIIVERSEKGMVYFKGQSGKYLQFKDGGLCGDSEVPSGFFIEIRDPTKMCIKTKEGFYVNSGKNGGISATCSDKESATKWEY